MDDVTAAGKDGFVTCPHIDRDDRRCNSRFCLDRMEQALGVCFGAYHACPMYHQINNELEEARASGDRTPIIVVTANGSPMPLRATGT